MAACGEGWGGGSPGVCPDRPVFNPRLDQIVPAPDLPVLRNTGAMRRPWESLGDAGFIPRELIAMNASVDLILD